MAPTLSSLRALWGSIRAPCPALITRTWTKIFFRHECTRKFLMQSRLRRLVRGAATLAAVHVRRDGEDHLRPTASRNGATWPDIPYEPWRDLILRSASASLC